MGMRDGYYILDSGFWIVDSDSDSHSKLYYIINYYESQPVG